MPARIRLALPGDAGHYTERAVLVVDQAFGVSGAELKLKCGITRGPGVYYARLDGVRWDGRVMPRSRQRRRPWTVLLYVRRGRVAVTPGSETFGAGSVVLVPERDIFGPSDGDRQLQTLDWASEGIALRWAEEHTAAPVRQPRLVTVPQALRRALEATVATMPDATEQALGEHLAMLLGQCTAAGLVRAAAQAGIAEPTDDRTVRTQEAMFETVEALSAQPMLVDASEKAGITERQVRRDVKRVQQEFDLFDDGFREVVRRWRLTAATLLLSARTLSVSEVAGAVGYGSATAMGRAFKQARLPTPSEVQRRLHEPSS